jgi:carboxymethylenebutenolidase
VGYYAGGIGQFAKEEPVCPVLLHFGKADTHIGPDQIEAVRVAHPEVTIYEYEGAKHAFNRDPDSNSYDPDAARLAWQRTLDFLKANLA